VVDRSGKATLYASEALLQNSNIHFDSIRSSKRCQAC